MTTDQKIDYIRSFLKLVVNSQTYYDALVHSNFVRGMLAAYHADQSISTNSFKELCNDLEVVMGVKRMLSVKGDIV